MGTWNLDSSGCNATLDGWPALDPLNPCRSLARIKLRGPGPGPVQSAPGRGWIMPEFASAPPPARQRPAGPSAALRCVLRPSPVSHLAGWIFHPKSTSVLEEVDEPDDMGHEGLIACSVISRDVSQTSSLLLQIAGTSRRRVRVELVLAAGYRRRLILRWASSISIRQREVWCCSTQFYTQSAKYVL